MKRKPATALPVRPVTDTQAACRLLAKQFAARRAMWLAHIQRRSAA
jgi:hypothetical protein